MGEGSTWSPWLVHAVVAGAAISIAAAANYYWRSTSSRGRCRVVGIIPARYQSSRFEGKPLALIMGKPMIQIDAVRLWHHHKGLYKFPFLACRLLYGRFNKQASDSSGCGLDPPRTWEQAMKATSLESVVVATDDERIAECCRGFGAAVVLTSEKCENGWALPDWTGTERCNEAAEKLSTKYDLVVNIQGDEPLIDPAIIDGIVLALQRSPDAVYSTAVAALKSEDATDPNRVKCVIDKNGYALYFSRGLIPFNKKGSANAKFPYNLHLGIQCYDTKFLAIYASMPSSPLQLEEDLEQIKVLENGYKMKVIKVDHEAHGVDVPTDIAKIEALMSAHNFT